MRLLAKLSRELAPHRWRDDRCEKKDCTSQAMAEKTAARLLVSVMAIVCWTICLLRVVCVHEYTYTFLLCALLGLCALCRGTVIERLLAFLPPCVCGNGLI